MDYKKFPHKPLNSLGRNNVPLRNAATPNDFSVNDKMVSSLFPIEFESTEFPLCISSLYAALSTLWSISRSQILSKFTNRLPQVRYAATEIHPTKSARARGAYLRVSFKNCREVAKTVSGWKLQRAVKFLENVQEHKEAVPMRRYAGGTGRAAQGMIWRRYLLHALYLGRLGTKLMGYLYRKAIRCLPRTMACQVCRVHPRSPQEC